MGLRSVEQSLQEILIGLAVNGLTEVVSRSTDNKEADVSEDPVTSAVVAAVANLTDVEEIHPTLGGEKLHEFLRSAEVHNVVRQVFASTEPAQVDRIEHEFYELWCIRASDPTIPSRAELDRLFRSMVGLCNRSLDEAIAAGNLTAIEAKAAQRHAELRGSLESIERALSVLERTPNLEKIDDYAKKYRYQLRAREGKITPPALDSARQLPIDSLYVPAQLEEIDSSSSKTVSYAQFADTLFRHVVLGNPGSGKSTLAKKLATDVARDRIELGRRPPGTVPFLVVLRDFGARKREDPCSIVEFIASISNSRYQLPPPDSAIEYLLLTNRAMVIFDGLDELLDTSYRAEISGDVESFANLYPSVPLLVTSREVGYPQAPLSPTTFSAFRLASFSEGQVEQYARNWFAVDDKGGPGKADQQAEAFMSDSAAVADLRSNALMLGLMCNLYKGSGYIPRNRPDVYEACANLLFDRWDRLRQIGKPLTIESLLRPAMQHLAAWIYADGELQSGVTEKQLIATTSAYLFDRRFESSEDAELEARRFIEFCRGRAWVFTDIGTTAAGERLYQFTHRTFLEFFTAEHLVRANPSPERLLAVLDPHIAVGEWDVVAQLAFQLLEHNVDGASDALLSSLSTDSNVGGANGNRLDFAVRSLEFLVPSPQVTRKLVERALDHLMEACTLGLYGDEWDGPDSGTNRIDTVMALITANPENTRPLKDVFVEKIGQFLDDPTLAPYAAELVLNLGLHSRPQSSAGRSATAETIAAQTMEKHGEQLKDVGRLDKWVGSDLVLAGQLETKEYLAAHGLEPFFQDRPYRLFAGTRRFPMAEIVVRSLLWTYPGRMSLETSLECLSGLSPHLTVRELSTVKISSSRGSWMARFGDSQLRRRDLDVRDLSVDQRYAALVLIALFVETFPRGRRSALLEEGQFGSAPNSGLFWDAVFSILGARASINNADAVLDTLERLELSADRRQVLREWAAGNLSF